MERRTQELQGRIDEMGAQLSQQKAQIAAAIKALSATNTAAQIAQILNIRQQQVEEILNVEA